MRKSTIAAVLGLVAVLVVAGIAAAGKGSSSMTLVVLSSGGAPAAASTQPSFGGQITFDVHTTETDHPSVNVRCYQDGTWVYDGWQSFWPGYVPDPIYTLSSNYWTSGAADCTARLVYFDRFGRLKTLTSMDFQVAA